jgi:hypothetical protein
MDARRSKGEYHLKEVRDFFRLCSLLDDSFLTAADTIKKLIDGRTQQNFPMWKIVAAAFLSKSRLASEKATAWLPSLADEDLRELQPYLSDIVSSRWVNQKTRHLARKYVNRSHY